MSTLIHSWNTNSFSKSNSDKERNGKSISDLEMRLAKENKTRTLNTGDASHLLEFETRVLWRTFEHEEQNDSRIHEFEN